MLLISRREDDPPIRIGNSIRVQLVQVGYGKVRLGITAPADVRIMREELLARDRRGRPELPAATRPPAADAGDLAGAADVTEAAPR